MKERRYYVHYDVTGHGAQKAGPYRTYADARVEEDDIKGYSGVRNTRIESEEGAE